MESGEFYLGWSDPAPKKAVSSKVRDAAQAYERRFGRPPAEVLVAPEELVQVSGVSVRAVNYIRRGNYWAGPIEEEQVQVRSTGWAA